MASTGAAALVRKMEKIKISASWEIGAIVMDPNHKIQQLKEKIHRKEGFPVERLRIHANGIEYPDHKTLRECEISDCTAVVMDPNHKILKEKIHRMDPNHKIQQLKEKIHRKEGFPVEWLRIHANGIEYPDHKTLRECEISDCTAVVMDPNHKILKEKIHRMDPNHKIQQLKEKIHRKEGFPVEWLRIHANGIEYPDHKTLRECEISDCTEVRAELLKSRTPLRVVVVHRGERISVEVDELDHISKLRYILEEVDFPIPEDHICIRNDRVMIKDQTFRWHRVDEGDKIVVCEGFYPDSGSVQS